MSDADLTIALRGVVKRFGDQYAVKRLDLDIAKGSFFSILGPSGCGKTTTLRMIAGFEQPTEGRILLDGDDMAFTPPHKRNVNTVFQNYALFPHLNVSDNVGFGLRRQKVGRQELRQRVGEALELVQLTGYEKRKPGQMSGGQQQRVALARALVLKPAVLLLDEPLGALDAKLRKALQVELKALQQQVGITFVYVTHDQEEALTMSDRIAVMADGRVEQVGPPREIYEEPDTVFVADFLGASNLMDAEAVGGANICRLMVGDFELDAMRGKTDARGPTKVTIRPERVHLEEHTNGGPNRIPGMVERLVYLGSAVQVITRLAVGTTIQVLVQNTGSEIPWKQGTAVQAYLPAEALRVLTDTGAALAPLDEAAVEPA
jgi:spermidine/putrescine transport system ATP-binding protein